MHIALDKPAYFSYLNCLTDFFFLQSEFSIWSYFIDSISVKSFKIIILPLCIWNHLIFSQLPLWQTFSWWHLNEGVLLCIMNYSPSIENVSFHWNYKPCCLIPVKYSTDTETKMSSFWRNFNHWLHWKLSFWQLPVQPVMKISSKWKHFRFSGCSWFIWELKS